MGKPQRDRVTIDLRGLREPLQTRVGADPNLSHRAD